MANRLRLFEHDCRSAAVVAVVVVDMWAAHFCPHVHNLRLLKGIAGFRKPRPIYRKEFAQSIDPKLITETLMRVLYLYTESGTSFISADYDELETYINLAKRTTTYEPMPSTNTILPSLVEIPAGEFLMGTSEEEIEHLKRLDYGLSGKTKDLVFWYARQWEVDGEFDAEKPQRSVFVETYQVGRYPITNAEYRIFVNVTGYVPPPYFYGDYFEEKLSHPVVEISAKDALEYCRWLTKQLHQTNQLAPNEVMRLPTEAEWEKAASWDALQDKKRIWPWGNMWDETRCNTDESSLSETTPVGKYTPNGDSYYGVADLAGNAWEWCADYSTPKIYEKSRNELLTEMGNEWSPLSVYSILKGGACSAHRGYSRTAFRQHRSPTSGHPHSGFRIVKGTPFKFEANA